MSREAFFKKHVEVDEATGCWNWTGALARGGYGAFEGDRGTTKSHRWAYAHYIGPIPDGLVIDHLCRNRKCCNPQHLEAVTQKENVKRGNSGKYQRNRKTHCKRGHELTVENTYTQQSGRTCRTCLKAREKKRVRDWGKCYVARLERKRRKREAELRTFLHDQLKLEVAHVQ